MRSDLNQLRASMLDYEQWQLVEEPAQINKLFNRGAEIARRLPMKRLVQITILGAEN